MFNAETPLRKGAVVSCRFPLTETPDQPGPSARPALIVRVFFDQNDEQWKAIVAYGTSRDTKSNAGFEIRIQRPEGLAQAGLHRPSRFILSRMRVLPINDQFFAYSHTGSPILGYLDDGLIQRLDSLCDKLVTVSQDLRGLLGGAATSVASQPDAEPEVQVAARAQFDVRAMDEFLKQSCTGRRDLNGANSFVVQKPTPTRRSGFLGRRSA
jgi:hypothetical protein